MDSSAPSGALVFGAFEVHPETGELRKHGIRVKLHGREFQVLLALLEKSGQVVTRGELQQRLWPRDTFVEFDNGLNNAVSRLRSVLGDSHGSPRFIETVPRHGYCFVAEVTRMPVAGIRVSGFGSWLARAASILLVLGAIGILVLWYANRTGQISSLAVLPFRDLEPGTDDHYFADGMTDAVTTELAKLGVPKVISETSVAQFKDTKESISEIARKLRVDAIVEGAVERQGDQVRITVQLIRADTDRHLWAESFERQMTDVLALQDDVAFGVAHAIKLKLSPGAPSQSPPPRQVKTDAYNAYLEGRYYLQMRSDEFLRSKVYFQQAIQLDPSYAPAYAGLSDYYVLEDDLSPVQTMPKAREYAQDALRLDSSLPDSHASLAYIDFYFDWNWRGADQEFQRSIALAPGLASSHRWYAIFLAAMGRTAAAMAEANRAADLDPLSISALDAAAAVAASDGHYDRSLEESHKILELDPNNPSAYADMYVVHFEKGMYQDALQDAEKGLALTHRDPFFLSLATLAQGRLGQMVQAAKFLEELRTASRMRYISPYLFAISYLGMGKQKEAIDALEKSYEAHDPYMVGLDSTPWIAPLRSDPRFRALLRRMNFPDVK